MGYLGNINTTAVTSSETVKGVAEIATQAETNAGTDDTKIVTPLKLANSPAGSSAQVTQATETVKGIAEIATQAETNAGTDDTKMVTPLKLSSYQINGGTY